MTCAQWAIPAHLAAPTMMHTRHPSHMHWYHTHSFRSELLVPVMEVKSIHFVESQALHFIPFQSFKAKSLLRFQLGVRRCSYVGQSSVQTVEIC